MAKVVKSLGELKNCPMCGDKRPVVRDILVSIYVKCNNIECGLAGPAKPTQKEAEAAWNRREGC